MFKSFKITALSEGISFLALLVNMLMIHGILCILYAGLAFLLKEEKKWNLKKFSHIILASFIPFGTFYIDTKYLK